MPGRVWTRTLIQQQEPVPQGCLDTAIEQVVEGIGNILGKHKLGDDNSIIVNSSVELLYGVFDRLCLRAWLNDWDIAAALEMTDRPLFVRLGLSVLLHKEDAYSEVTHLLNPLRRWRKKIDNHRYKDKNNLERPTGIYLPTEY